MMQKIIVGAGVALIFQLGLVALVFLRQSEQPVVPPHQAYLSFSINQVDGITLVDETGETLSLKKNGLDWRLPADYGVLADRTRVDGFLARLAELQQGFIVATSAEAARRFKVAKESFAHHLQLFHGDSAIIDLYLGTSSAFRQVHVRKAGEEEIFSVNLPTFELTTAIDGWLDKVQAAVKSEELAAISLNDFTLRRVGNRWQLDDDKEAVNQEKAGELAAKFTSLHVMGGADPVQAERLLGGPSAWSCRIERSSGDTVTYRFAKASNEDSYVMQRTDVNRYFTVHALVAEGLQKMTRIALLAPAEAVSDTITKPPELDQENKRTLPQR